MHPARKFSQNNTKSKPLSIRHQNKQNKEAGTQLFAKKYSVGNHALSEQYEMFPHKKSIAEEKISVFLDQSQNKTYAFEKRNFENNELKYLNMVLENKDGCLFEVLNKELGKDMHSKEMKKLLCTLLERLEDEKGSESIATDENKNNQNFELQESVIRPYLEQEIMLLQKNLDNLRKREEDLDSLSRLNKSEKGYLLQTLRRLEEDQSRELEEFQKFLSVSN